MVAKAATGEEKKRTKGKDCGPAENSNVNDSSNRADAPTSLNIRGSPTSLPFFLPSSSSFFIRVAFLFSVACLFVILFSAPLIELLFDRVEVDRPERYPLGLSGDSRRCDQGLYWYLTGQPVAKQNISLSCEAMDWEIREVLVRRIG